MDKATAKDFNLDEDTPQEFIDALDDVREKIKAEIKKNQNTPAETLYSGIFRIVRNFAVDIIEKADKYKDIAYTIKNLTKQEIAAEKSEKASISIQQRWDKNPQRNAEIEQTINIAKEILLKSQKKHTLSSLENEIRNYCAKNGIEHIRTPQTYKGYIEKNKEIMKQLDCERLRKSRY
jgi:hypothetical protein